MAPKPKPKAKSKPKANVTASLNPTTDNQWRIQDDARTLKQAMEIKKDPKRMQQAKEYCTKEMEALKQVSKMK